VVVAAAGGGKIDPSRVTLPIGAREREWRQRRGAGGDGGRPTNPKGGKSGSRRGGIDTSGQPSTNESSTTQRRGKKREIQREGDGSDMKEAENLSENFHSAEHY